MIDSLLRSGAFELAQQMTSIPLHHRATHSWTQSMHLNDIG
jgi:hypothetical protein